MLEQLGKRIKQMREERELTLKNVSEVTGLSVGFLSQVERNITDPSIASLKKIADAFGVKITEFFEKVSQKNFVIKKDERSKLLLGNSKVVYELLASTAMERKMEPILKIIESGAFSGQVDGHEGEEFAFILEGCLEVSVGDDSFFLEEGDSIYFDAKQSHMYKNVGDKKCVCIWVVSPPTFS